MKFANGDVIMHAGKPYDPKKAHEYYERTKHLKGRKTASFQAPPASSQKALVPLASAKTAKGFTPVDPKVRAKRKAALKVRIQELEDKLKKVEEWIKAIEDRAKPDTAAEKSEKARDAKKYRDKHKQEIKAKAKTAAAKSGGSSASKAIDDGGAKQLASLKADATKLKGKISIAKTKLSAL